MSKVFFLPYFSKLFLSVWPLLEQVCRKTKSICIDWHMEAKWWVRSDGRETRLCCRAPVASPRAFMLMENHMTLQLPLSGFILYPIDTAKVWKRRWCRHLMQEDSLFLYCYCFQGTPEACTVECGTTDSMISPLPDVMWSQHWAGLHCCNIVIKVAQKTNTLFLGSQLYLKVGSKWLWWSVSKNCFPVMLLLWEEWKGESASTTEAGFVKGALRMKEWKSRIIYFLINPQTSSGGFAFKYSAAPLLWGSSAQFNYIKRQLNWTLQTDKA